MQFPAKYCYTDYKKENATNNYSLNLGRGILTDS